MSVLFKALQKAEKENEQRQSATAGKGFDAERVAGSGPTLSSRGRGGKMRWAALAGTGVLAAAIIAGVLFLSPQPEPQRPQVAALTPPRAAAPQPAAPPTASQLAAAPAQTPPGETAVAQAPAATPEATVAAAPPAVEAPPAKTTEATVAEKTPAAVPAPAPSPVPAAPALAAPAQAAAVQAPAQANVSAAQTAVPAKAAPAPPALAALEQKKPERPVEVPANSPAQALNPPISVARADFALAGVGNMVQVRQVSQEAQNSVGSGYAALLRGEYDTALGFYDAALNKEPHSVLALLGRGAALQRLHRLEEAQVSYDAALKIDPANREALTNVTSIIGERSPSEALNRLIELEKTYPAFSPIKAQIGLIYAKNGAMDQALEYLRRAVTLTPESAMYKYNLALVMDHMGLTEQAILVYKDVLGAIVTGRAPADLTSTEIERRVRYLQTR